MSAVVEGTHIRSACKECGAELILSLIEPDGHVVEGPSSMLMKWAEMLLCDDCSDKWQHEKASRAGREAVEKRVREAGIPPAFRELSFDDMLATSEARKRTIDRAQIWATASDPRGLLIYGKAGAGKSRLAATALWKRLERTPCRWVSVMVLFAQLQAAFSDDQRKEALRTLRGIDGLVLDDIDKIPLGENSRSHLLVAIDQRITQEVPLLITSNLEPKALKAHFGEAISSRITGYCAAYALEGVDKRMELGR